MWATLIAQWTLTIILGCAALLFLAGGIDSAFQISDITKKENSSDRLKFILMGVFLPPMLVSGILFMWGV